MRVVILAGALALSNALTCDRMYTYTSHGGQSGGADFDAGADILGFVNESDDYKSDLVDPETNDYWYGAGSKSLAFTAGNNDNYIGWAIVDDGATFAAESSWTISFDMMVMHSMDTRAQGYTWSLGYAFKGVGGRDMEEGCLLGDGNVDNYPIVGDFTYYKHTLTFETGDYKYSITDMDGNPVPECENVTNAGATMGYNYPVPQHSNCGSNANEILRDFKKHDACCPTCTGNTQDHTIWFGTHWSVTNTYYPRSRVKVKNLVVGGGTCTETDPYDTCDISMVVADVRIKTRNGALSQKKNLIKGSANVDDALCACYDYCKGEGDYAFMSAKLKKKNAVKCFCMDGEIRKMRYKKNSLHVSRLNEAGYNAMLAKGIYN